MERVLTGRRHALVNGGCNAHQHHVLHPELLGLILGFQNIKLPDPDLIAILMLPITTMSVPSG